MKSEEDSTGERTEYTVYTDDEGNYVDADNDLGKLNIVVKEGEVTTSTAINIEKGERTSNLESISFDEVGTERNDDETIEYKVEIVPDSSKTLTTDDDYIYRQVKLKVSVANVVQDTDLDGNTQKYTDADGNIKTLYFDVNGNYQGYDADDNLKYYEKGDVYNSESKIGQYDAVDYAFFGSTKNPVKVLSYGERNSDGKRVDANGATVDPNGEFYMIQKISKESGDDKDDAKLPKSTETYFISDREDYLRNQESVDTKDLVDEDSYKFTVSDGQLVRYEFKDDDGSYVGNDDDDSLDAWTYSLTNKNGFYYYDDDDDDVDIDDEDEYDVTTDVNGDLWALSSGKVYKYDASDAEFKQMYRVDGSLNELSVYDEDSIIVYNEDEEIYAIKGGESSTGKYVAEDEDEDTEETTDSKDTTTVVTTGWVSNIDGTWNFINADGTKAIGWVKSPYSGVWYYMDAQGTMRSNGWIQDGANWYFLKSDGAMATGWMKSPYSGKWYYLNNSGAMVTGWVKSPYSGKWYYLDASGAMMSNTTVNGYVLGADGAWIA